MKWLIVALAASLAGCALESAPPKLAIRLGPNGPLVQRPATGPAAPGVQVLVGSRLETCSGSNSLPDFRPEVRFRSE